MTVDEYLGQIPEARLGYFGKLRQSIRKGLPKGFKEVVNYGMIGYVVPLSLYEPGYHCNPKEPLPFINIASKKDSINLYHMGLYGNREIKDWFFEEYAKLATHKIDNGKGCIRFKYPDEIPFELISELAARISVDQWIDYYEKSVRPKAKKAR